MVKEMAVWRRGRRLFGGLLVERVISVWGRKEVAVFGESGWFWCCGGEERWLWVTVWRLF